jgi:hypothetical protein
MYHSIRISQCFLALGLGACSGNVVNLGEGQTPLTEPPPPSARCRESTVVDGDVLITEQAQIDDLAGCETIQGDLSVQPPLDPDLRPLSSLKTVTGAVSLIDDPRLRFQGSWDAVFATSWISSLEGLDGLEFAGSLKIISDLMPDLQPLSHLRALTGTGELHIDINNIQDLAPLANLGGIHSLSVRGEQLQSIAALRLPARLDELTVIGPQLSEFGSASLVKTISGTLDINGTGLRDLTDFSELEQVGRLSITGNGELRSLAGLEKLTGVAGIDITRNPLLQDISALSNVNSTVGLAIVENASLQHIPAFPGLPVNALAILDNAALDEIDLVGDTSILLSPTFHPAMESLAVWGNPRLEHFVVPAGWQQASSMVIAGNALLKDLDLGAIVRLGTLAIKGNPLLERVGHAGLSDVDVLSVVGNPALPLSGFASVQTRRSELSSEPIPPLDCSSTDCYPLELARTLADTP